MAFGVTPEGFVPKTLADLQQEMGEEIQAAFSAAFKVDLPSSLVAQVIGITSAKIEECWQILQATSSLDPDNKEGADLVALCALTGTTPLAPRSSTVTLTLTGTDGTLIPEGSTASVVDVGDKFDTLEDATLAPAALWATSTGYVVGQYVRTNNGGHRVYICTDPGTSLGSGTGPSGTGTAISDSGVVWRYVGEGLAYAEVPAASQETGEVFGPAFTLTVIETPVSGWSNVTNALDATLGRGLETDAELRLRRLVELRGGGAGTPDSIRAAVLAVPGVTSCSVFHNVTDVDDVDGIPPHSVEVLVRDGDEQAIADVLWQEQVAAGIRTFGGVAASVVDSEGHAQDVNFSRPEEVDVYVDVELKYVTADYPADGDAQVKAAVATALDALPVGFDVFALSLVPAVLSVSGVYQVVVVEVGTSPSPSGSTVAITKRQVATGDTTRVVVTSSSGTP